MAYIELSLKSAYSLLYGVHRPESLLDRAAAQGCRRAALTDINSLYGLPAFMEAAAERAIWPIIGAELRDSIFDGAGRRRFGQDRVVALAKNRQGFGDLCQILSDARQVDFDLGKALSMFGANLVLISDSENFLDRLSGRVPALYAALTPTSQALVSLARRRGLPLAILGDVLFLEAADFMVHRVLRAIDLNKTIGSLAAGDLAPNQTSFLQPELLERRLAAWPEAFSNVQRIAEACQFDRIFDGFIFPAYVDDSGRSAATLLRERCLAGAERRYGELPDAVLDRIDYELDIIEHKGFADYFLVVDDIIALASRTCGRGSAAASIVAYALGLTNVDPIAYNLYFERFLNPSRPDPPDIDIDFAWDERDSLIKAVIERFGPAHCARVANHNCFRYRSALRETAKAFGIGDGEISARERQDRIRSEGTSPEDGPGDDPLWAEIRRVAKRLVGLPRGLSMHCGGLVITPGPIKRACPVVSSADGYPLLAWEKDGVEAAGLIKIDLLGNRSLAVIRDALANLAEQGLHIDPVCWRPADDPATIAALARGDSLGVFYIESPAMRQLQKKAAIGDFDHIVIHSSIIRPAANHYISEYIRRLRGEKYQAIHPLLDRILAETYGILCYQEDVSKTAVALAGFDEAEADRLRKIIAKKAGSANLTDYEKRFAAGCQQRGLTDQEIKTIWEMMLSFSGYSFCKPHSASYAMVSFQSAYLRVHHGAAFMAAVLANRGGFYKPSAYISEVRRMGLKLHGPDIQTSRYLYYAWGDTVIIGLQAIANLTRSAAEAIVAERQAHGRFLDLSDLRRRVRLSRDDCLALVDSGALDGLGLSIRSRQTARTKHGGGHLSRQEQARFLLTETAKTYDIVQPLLFDWDPETTAARQPAVTPPALKLAYPSGQSPQAEELEADLIAEFRSLGFLRHHHPLYLWRRQLRSIKRESAERAFQQKLGRQVSLIGWPVTQKEVLTKEGRPMDFVSFEDESALYETVLFPDIYNKYAHCLYEQRPLILEGKIEDDQGARYLNISSIREI